MSSFSSQVKAELCRGGTDRPCCARAELYGALLFSGTFTPEKIRIVTECEPFISRIKVLLGQVMGFGFDSDTRFKQTEKRALQVTDPDKLQRIFSFYGYDPAQTLVAHMNLAFMEEECCRAAFWRGAFLSAGSVTDPGKKYHLDMITHHMHLCREGLAMLREMEFAPRTSMRQSRHILYFKASEAIEDFLTTIGAPASSMALMEAKVEKDLRNQVNRKVNCETANLSKTVAAAQDQMAAITLLKSTGALEGLPEPLRETARIRMENPEATLSELSALHDPPIGRSGLNHRLRRLSAMAARNDAYTPSL